jgi:hypothetical protein
MSRFARFYQKPYIFTVVTIQVNNDVSARQPYEPEVADTRTIIPW